jgi:hypothetical protein
MKSLILLIEKAKEDEIKPYISSFSPSTFKSFRSFCLQRLRVIEV